MLSENHTYVIYRKNRFQAFRSGIRATADHEAEIYPYFPDTEPHHLSRRLDFLLVQCVLAPSKTEVGSSWFPQPSLRNGGRCDFTSSPGSCWSWQERLALACRPAQAQATQAGSRGAGQQDRPHRLEDDGHRRKLSKTCCSARPGMCSLIDQSVTVSGETKLPC